jgi:hypothetical protein
MFRTFIIAVICILQWSALLLGSPLQGFTTVLRHIVGNSSVSFLDAIPFAAVFGIQALIAFGGIMKLAAISPFEERRKSASLGTLRVIITQFVLTTLLVGVINIDRRSENFLYSFMLLSGLLGGIAAFIMTSLRDEKTRRKRWI